MIGQNHFFEPQGGGTLYVPPGVVMWRPIMRERRNPMIVVLYPYQEELADLKEPWPDLLDILTGLGETAAFVIRKR